MTNFFNIAVKKIIETRWKYYLFSSSVRVCGNGKLSIGKKCQIKNSRIFVTDGSELHIGNDILIDGAYIYVDGTIIVEDFAHIIGTTITVNDGSICVGHHSKLALRRIWVRFGGKLSIGKYTNINSGSEIRADNSVEIGDFTMISYGVNIWDTNTHTLYPKEKRRDITISYWPYFGKEIQCPKTKPIKIGSDCWLGQNVSILKGSEIGNGTIVGYHTIISNRIIEENKIVVSHLDVNIFDL